MALCLFLLAVLGTCRAQTTTVQTTTLFQDTNWERMAPASTSPGRRYGAASLSMGSPKGLLLFGGVDEHGLVLGDTWQYFSDQNRWVELKLGSDECCGKNCTVGVPCPRAYSSLHQVGTRALLFGGSCDLTGGQAHLERELLETVTPCEDVLWEFDLLNNKWRRVYPEGYQGATEPPPRTAHAAVSRHQSLFVYGGRTGTNWAADQSQDERGLWEYRWDLNKWYRLDPQGEMLRNGMVLDSLTFSPQKRYGHAAVLHQYQQKTRILFHGGFRLVDTTGKVKVTSDILEWDIAEATWRKWDLQVGGKMSGRIATSVILTREHTHTHTHTLSLSLSLPLQYSPFRAFHTAHLYSPSSAMSQGTGYLVMCFGYGHDKPNTVTVDDVVSSDTDVVRGVDIHVFDDNSATAPDFLTYEVLGGLKPAARRASGAAFTSDGTLMAAGGYADDQGRAVSDAYWKLHLKGQLYDQGSLVVPVEVEEAGCEEIIVMSGEVEIASWVLGTTPLPATLSIPSGADIVALAFQKGIIVASEALTIVPQETKTLQLVYLERQQVALRLLREDAASALPLASVSVEVFDVRRKVWHSVSEGSTDLEGQFRADLVPVRGLYEGLLAPYAASYETSYRIRATVASNSTTGAPTVIVNNELIEVRPGQDTEKSYVSEEDTLPERTEIALPLPDLNSTATNSTKVVVVTNTEVESRIFPLQYGYFATTMHPLGARQEFKLVVDADSGAPIGLFASLSDQTLFPTAAGAEWVGNCQGSLCTLTFATWPAGGGGGRQLALGVVTNATSAASFSLRIRAEIVEKPEEIPPPPPALPQKQKQQISIDLEMILGIVGGSVGSVLAVLAAAKAYQRRKRRQAVLPKSAEPAKLGASSDVEAGKGREGGWDDVMSTRNKDASADLFEDFGELASEYQRWMTQGDGPAAETAAMAAGGGRDGKLAALQKLSVKYEALEEGKKQLEGLPLAQLSQIALETKKKPFGLAKAKKSENGLVVPRAPAGILPPQTTFPGPPSVDSPVGYDLTPHKRPDPAQRDPRLTNKENLEVESQFLAQVREGLFLSGKTTQQQKSKNPKPLLAGRLTHQPLSPSKIAADGGISARDTEAGDAEESSHPPPPPPRRLPRLDPASEDAPRPPVGSGITPPASPGTRPPPPPRPRGAQPAGPTSLADILEGKDGILRGGKAKGGAPKNKLQGLRGKKKDPKRDGRPPPPPPPKD